MSCKWLGYLISGWVFCMCFWKLYFFCMFSNGGVSHSVGCYHSSVLCICVWHLLGIRVTTNLQAKCNDCGEFPIFSFIYQVWYLQSYIFCLVWHRLHVGAKTQENQFQCSWDSHGFLIHGVVTTWSALETFYSQAFSFASFSGNHQRLPSSAPICLLTSFFCNSDMTRRITKGPWEDTSRGWCLATDLAYS